MSSSEIDHVWIEIISKWIAKQKQQTDIKTNIILTKCLGFSVNQCDMKSQVRVRNVMRYLGYTSVRKATGGSFWIKL